MLIGARQVRKTTKINTLLADNDYLFVDGDDHSVAEIISNASTEALKSIIGTYKYLFIDDPQRIPYIGLKLKIIVDQIKDIQVVVSGSFAFDLNNATQEALTFSNNPWMEMITSYSLKSAILSTRLAPVKVSIFKLGQNTWKLQ